MAEIKIEGIGALKADFERLNFSKRKPVLVKAALEGIEQARVVAALIAPRGDTGVLSGNIRTAENRKVSDAFGVTVDVGPTTKAFYGLFQEFGTAFMPPQPFLGPAVEATAEKVQEKTVEALQREIDKALS